MLKLIIIINVENRFLVETDTFFFHYSLMNTNYKTKFENKSFVKFEMSLLSLLNSSVHI